MIVRALAVLAFLYVAASTASTPIVNFTNTLIGVTP